MVAIPASLTISSPRRNSPTRMDTAIRRNRLTSLMEPPRVLHHTAIMYV